MARLVIDTNSLLQCISCRSRYLVGFSLDIITNNPYTQFVTPYFHFKLIISDPDDDKFVDCAIAANAKFVVTDDGHFDVLKQIDFPKVEIIGLDDMICNL